MFSTSNTGGRLTGEQYNLIANMTRLVYLSGSFATRSGGVT